MGQKEDGLSAANQFKILMLFLGHASCSIFLVIINKSISVSYSRPWTVVTLQNTGTIVCSLGLHLAGRIVLRPLQRNQFVPLLIDAVWLVVVLFSSFKALEEVSVPLYVVVRNLVPFLTAVCERIALKKEMDFHLVLALLVTFSGTVLYSVSDLSIASTGAIFAWSNALLVAGMCVYERYLMTTADLGLSAIDVNFHRVLLSMPMMFIGGFVNEGFPATLLELSEQRSAALMVFSSAFAAFGIGTLLLALQAEVSATTIQVANVAYKCLTTLVSRLTHPAEVSTLGYVGYGVCTGGVLMYTLTRQALSKNNGAKGEEKKSK
eukprot:TRINITY_DN12563_c0_g3_i1.p1 TRINITY_DN12563_c0_g3~~TRINITY_DN12563_c0_g3_i1.p1  ORF type:complete len:321 (-),score=49.69 TRINITY_DN12563_c0_g3_i1:128-1090(-)